MTLTRKKLKIIYLLAFLLWSVILFFFVQMYKTEVWGMDLNPFYVGTIWVLFPLSFVYVHLFITKQIFINLLLCVIFYWVAFTLSVKITESLILFYGTHDPILGLPIWAYRFKFLDVILGHAFTLLLLELAKKALPKKIRISLSEPFRKTPKASSANEFSPN